jgi:hypothetical protein
MTIIRPVTTEDRPMLESWIAAEPTHPDNTFEFYQSPKSKTVVYEDAEGPVFVARFSSALRVDMDFNPDASPERIRTMFAGELPSVARQAKDQGFSEVVFESFSKKLIAFLRAFGFRSCPDYRKTL